MPASAGRSPARPGPVRRPGGALSSLREEDFAVADPPRRALHRRRAGVIDRHGLSWHVQRLGCRAEYWFCPPPRDGAAAAAPSTRSSRAYAPVGLNRGVLLTPFHNMALFSPAHSEADVHRHTEVFGAAVDALVRLNTDSSADRRDFRRWESQTNRSSGPHVRQLGDRPAGGESFPLELGDRTLVPPRHHPAGPASARRPAPRPSTRRSRPSQWPAATWRRGPAAIAARAANSRLTSRRLWCRSGARGRGRRSRAPANCPGPIRCSIDQTASTEQNRTLVAARLGHPPQRVRDAGPPDLEGQHVVRRPGPARGPRWPRRCPGRSRR